MFKSLLKNKKIIFISGNRKKETVEFLEHILKDNLRVYSTDRLPDVFDILSVLKNDVILVEDNMHVNTEIIKDYFSLLKNCFFIFTETKKKSRVRKFLKGSPEDWSLILDSSISQKLRRKRGKRVLTFGINKKRADFVITDIYHKEGETNFKVSYKEKVLPFWVGGKLKKKEIYGVLPALCIAKMFGLNLAEISCKIKEDKKKFFTLS